LVIKRCESALGSSLKVLHGMLLKEKHPGAYTLTMLKVMVIQTSLF